MNVRVRIQFERPTEDDCEGMRSLANGLTDNRDSVHVFADPEQTDRLVAKFTMPTEPQYRAVKTIYRNLRYHAENGVDPVIEFPRTEEEIARAKRKAERRKRKREEG